MDDSWVFDPTKEGRPLTGGAKAKRRRRRRKPPRRVVVVVVVFLEVEEETNVRVHFIGGAFVGASPQLNIERMLRRLVGVLPEAGDPEFRPLAIGRE